MNDSPDANEWASPDGRMPELIRRSTRAMWREGRRTPGYSLFDFVHGYAYGRWPFLYIGTGLGYGPLSKIIQFFARLYVFFFAPGSAQRAGNSFADGYHGKVMPLAEATRLISINEPVNVRDLEQVIPYEKARSIILQDPDHIVVLQCPCRSARPEPCSPLEVCLIVGEPFASFVLDHQPKKSRAINQVEAAAILRAENERGHVHHAFFKDAMLGRFYAICNCCACCCGAMSAHRNGTPMLTSSGYVAEIDEDLCIGCGDCVEFCQFGALSLNGGMAVVDRSRCMGCGVCASKCLNEASQLVRDPAKGQPLEVQKLMTQAAQVPVS